MSKLRIGFVLTGSFCTFAKVMPVIYRNSSGDGHDSVRQRQYLDTDTRSTGASEADHYRHLPYRQHCFRRADWTEGAV